LLLQIRVSFDAEEDPTGDDSTVFEEGTVVRVFAQVRSFQVRLPFFCSDIFCCVVLFQIAEKYNEAAHAHTAIEQPSVPAPGLK